jgi:hypothetical protein
MTASNNLPLTLAKLPEKLREQLNSCPAEGNGIHSWLFRTALRLHERFAEDEIVEILKTHLTCRRPEREILESVTNSGKVARGEMPNNRNPWPGVDYEMVYDIVVRCPVRLEDLRTISPEDLRTDGPRTEDILDKLFPGNPFLCFGRSPGVFWTKPREFWRGKESGMQFIVPNAMASLEGKTKEGKNSVRCLDNTGERQFLVIEFDIAEAGDWGPHMKGWQARGISTFDAQAALLVHLATKDLPRFPLTMAVNSGKRSLHGWFRCQGLPEEQTQAFMERAVRLGADAATWIKCQLVRMPGGTRDDGSHQGVEYFNPGTMGKQEEAN